MALAGPLIYILAEANGELSFTMHPKDRLNYAKARKKIVAFIRRKTRDAEATGVVLGLSGGLDSAVTAFLCTEALGADKVLAVVMPVSDVTPKHDLKRARTLAKDLGIRQKVIDIKPAIDLDAKLLGRGNKLSTGNLMARTRMNYLYFYANTMNRLVVGTGDRSEVVLGYFTKYGDGGVDFLPIGGLYKTQVREMARRLGVPKEIVESPSSPAFWPGHSAEEEIGFTYELLDQALDLIQKDLPVAEICRQTGLSIRELRRIKEMIKTNVHKRNPPEICEI